MGMGPCESGGSGGCLKKVEYVVRVGSGCVALSKWAERDDDTWQGVAAEGGGVVFLEQRSSQFREMWWLNSKTVPKPGCERLQVEEF